MNDSAIILAAGVGSRMQRADGETSLDAEQTAVADSGIKAMIHIDRPFLDYLLSNIADAGYTRVCLVISPHQQQVRDYYDNLSSQRLQIEYAVQQEQLGTANALAAAEEFVGEDYALVLNGDNYYPVEALQQLLEAKSCALSGFDRNQLIEQSNISAERITAFAIIQQDSNGNLTNIVEKPAPEFVKQLSEPVLISMNCWRVGPSIFEACRKIDLSPRGEYELTDAVMYSIRNLDELYQVLRPVGGVLDLSCRTDIQAVTEYLQGVEVRL